MKNSQQLETILTLDFFKNVTLIVCIFGLMMFPSQTNMTYISYLVISILYQRNNSSTLVDNIFTNKNKESNKVDCRLTPILDH